MKYQTLLIEDKRQKFFWTQIRKIKNKIKC